MVRLRATRRTLLGAAFFTASVKGSGAAPVAVTADERALALQVGDLLREMHALTYDDPIAEAAHYVRAQTVLDSVLGLAATPAGLRVMAAALLWCHGGSLEPPADATVAERLVAAITLGLLTGSEHLENISRLT